MGKYAAVEIIRHRPEVKGASVDDVARCPRCGDGMGHPYLWEGARAPWPRGERLRVWRCLHCGFKTEND